MDGGGRPGTPGNGRHQAQTTASTSPQPQPNNAWGSNKEGGGARGAATWVGNKQVDEPRQKKAAAAAAAAAAPRTR